jgi:hypothetical protein
MNFATIRNHHLLTTCFLVATALVRSASAAEPVVAPGASKARLEPAADESLADYVKRAGGRFAYGLYVGKQKVGWTVDEMKLGELDGKPVAIVSNEGRMDMLVMGEPSKYRWNEKSCFELSGDGTIARIEETTIEDDRTTKITAERKGDGLTVHTVASGVTTNRDTGLPKDTLKLQQQLDRWLAGVSQAGAEFRAFSTSFDAEDINRSELYQFQSRRPYRWGGVATELIELKVTSDGAVCEMDALPNGTAIKGKLGPFDMRLEEEAAAKNLQAALVDLGFEVPVATLLGDPRNVDSLTIEVSDLGEFQIPANGAQQVRQGRGGATIVEIKRQPRPAKPKPLDAATTKDMLKSTPTMQADDPKIRKLAAEIVENIKEPRAKAERINRWVHGNLKQTYQANATSALEVLANKAGDCSEHTLLFVALCRAAGVPAREVGGVAYDESQVVGRKRHRGTFGWHAWGEIHNGQQWVSMDPTWDETVVDATHLTMSIGSNDFAWVNVLGKMKINVVEFSTRK